MIIEAIDDSVLLVSLATAVLGFSAIQRVLVRQRGPQQAQQPRWRRPDDAAPEECAVCLAAPSSLSSQPTVIRDPAHATRIAMKALRCDDVCGQVWHELVDGEHALAPDLVRSRLPRNMKEI